MPEETTVIDEPIEPVILDEEGNPLEYVEAPSTFTIQYDATSTDSILNEIYLNQVDSNTEIIKELKSTNELLLKSIDNYKMNNSLILCVLFVLMFINFKEYLRGWLND